MKPILTAFFLGAISFQLQAQVAFTLSSSPNVGGNPTSVATADVNGDGKQDLISANFNDNTLTVLTNNGSGVFVLASTPGVGSNPGWVTAVDINGDGKPGLVSANYYGNSLSVLTNNGSGSFVNAGTYPVGQYPRQVAAADMNGDGKLDLVCASEGANTLSIYTNGGNGGFVLSGTLSVGSGAGYVLATDVNGDGKVDLISANYNDNTLTVLTNNGSGGFVLAATPAVGSGPRQIATADINGDGKVDLINANFNDNTLTVLTNKGGGAFGLAATLNVGNGPVSVVATNFSSSGKVDLACVNYYDNTLTVLTNNGNGVFILGPTLNVGNGPWPIAAADLNGDGRLDLICANTLDNTLSVLLNSTPSLPIIITQPVNQTVTVGSNATFSVVAAGSGPLSYQWNFGLQKISGATNALLTLTNVQSAQAGGYTVLVTNVYGSLLSSNAILTIAPDHFTWSAIPSPRYVNTPFIVSIQARDQTNGLFTAFNGVTSLSSTNGISVAPVVSGNFVQGQWTGSLTISQTTSNLVLRADDGLGHFGLSNPINVIVLPNLSMMRSGGIAVFMWPVGYPGFVLQTSSSLSPAVWNAVLFSPVQFGNLYVLPMDMSGASGFYRLWFSGP